MINVIILDTNILRGLGPNFFDKIDYISLQEYCYSSASEIIIPNAVLLEYLDYYKRELPELKAFFKGQILDEEEIFEEFILNITDSLIGFFLQTKRHFFHFKATNTFSKYPICHFHIIFFVSS